MNIFHRIEDNKQWDDLLESALFKTFFHGVGWENFLEREFSWIKFEHYVWRDELLLSVARCNFLGGKKIMSHPLCEYGGPLPLKTNVDLEGFAEDFIQEFGPNARIRIHPFIVNFGSIPSQFRDEGLSTFWIEDFSKKTTQDLLGSFRKTLKQEIKKSEQHGIDILECKTGEDLKKFYSLYLETIKRQRSIPLPYSVFEFFDKHAKIFIAKKSEQIIGGSVFLRNKPFIHYFINASDYKLRGLNIGHRILWHVIQEYAGKEYDYFDLGGTRKGSSLEIFKNGWGTKKYSIYEIGSNSDRSISEWKRSAWSALPGSVVKKAAPHALYWTV